LFEDKVQKLARNSKLQDETVETGEIHTAKIGSSASVGVAVE
jgi:hypothetical protein